MPDVHLTIDGVPVTVPAGTNIVDAARLAGIAIPVFCYHPKIRAVGMCRMCLVAVGTPKLDRVTREVVLDKDGKPEIAMMPKLQAACTTPVSEGMAVLTETEEVKFVQKGVLEFLLTSHPLDCPVCDKGGECPLQNLTMGWGPETSRYDYGDKVHFEKPVPLGDLILLDRERCILCSRCVRFQDDLADDPVLGFSSRGRGWHIISKSNPPFDSKFSGNTTDICPVGALTTADFRFRSRVWELKPVPSICTLCSVGCNVTLDMRYDNILRVMPRENDAVNEIWLCDKGRFGHHFVESNDRLTKPMVRRGGKLEPVSWEEAFHTVAEKLTEIQRTAGSEAMAGIAGEHLPNEDLYLFQRLFREVLGSNNLDHRVGAPGEPTHDDVGALLGVGVGTNLTELGKGTAVLVFGADPEEEAPLYMLRLRAIAERGGDLIVANARPTKLDRSASLSLRYTPGSEVQVVRALLNLVLEEIGTQRLPLGTSGLAELRSSLNAASPSSVANASGISEADLRSAARRFIQAENGIIIYGADAMAWGPAFIQELSNLAVVTGKVGKANNGLIPLLPRGNSRGALDMGVRPDQGPGYQPLSRTGLSAREIWGAAHEKRLRGLYVMGLDPVSVYPVTRAALESVEFLVVQDMFLTPTAQMAHVVLPAASVAERDGTYTNVERRVQRARKARSAPGLSRPDWEIIQGVAAALATVGLTRSNGKIDQPADTKPQARKAKPKSQSQPTEAPTSAVGWDYMAVSEIANEIAERVPGYAGITHTALEKTGKRGIWGRQPDEAVFYDGTNYENVEGIGIQYPARAEQPKPSFSLKPQPLDVGSSDKRHSFLLLVQKVLYDGDSLLRDSKLVAHMPAAFVALNTNDAQRLGISAGDRVRVSSSLGSLTLPARVVADVPTGSILIPANLSDAPLATIQTGPRTRVSIEKDIG